MISVVNVRQTRQGVHYVGRACGGFQASALANQWRGLNVGGKEQAIQLYREWLHMIIERGAFRDESCPARLTSASSARRRPGSCDQP